MNNMELKEKSIADLFPYYFKLESGDLQWYESMGFEMLFDNFTTQLEKVAKEYGMKSIIDPEEHSESVDNCSENFCNGACWYISNHDKLIRLPANQYGNAIVIAQILYAKEVCEDAYVPSEENWTQHDAFNYICNVESDFAAGVDWAEKEVKK